MTSNGMAIPTAQRTEPAMSPRTAKPRGTKPFEIDVSILAVQRSAVRADHYSGNSALALIIREPHGQRWG
jgi:hypothetical protein